MTDHLSPADLLLRQLAALSRADHGQEPTTDWNGVASVAADHGLTPLLFKRLKESGARADVPADVWERLRQAYFASAVRGMRLYGELRPVLRCLRSAGIPVIVLKGAFLAEAVYGDAALRPMCDVDLMVPKADVPKAHTVLLDMDRACQRPAAAESQGGKGGLRIGAGIDDCWTIDIPGGRSKLDLAGLWARARPATVAGVEVLALCPDDLLLHICLHTAYRHGLGDGLRPFCDVAETICRFSGEMDWPQVVARAREWEASRYVGLMLHLARSMLNAAVPGEVIDQLVPGGVDQHVATAARRSVLDRTGYMERMPFFGRLGAKSLGEKAALAWERVFLSRGEMAAIYHASRNSRHFYFYYALRLRDVSRTLVSHALTRGKLMMQSRGRDRNVSLVKWLRSGQR